MESYKVKIPTEEEWAEHKGNEDLLKELAILLKVQAKWNNRGERVLVRVKKLLKQKEELEDKLGVDGVIVAQRSPKPSGLGANPSRRARIKKGKK